ncbi:alanine--tRNA ligase, cytoplasmic-like [Argiope bruennichi]|uniref:alanine--tRNA ligase, cytoplasmic-like n=1 Tax=Argiope bruennichi TaxID=94029 RepID=UPI00249535D7|nr:alanine--tRNA ligase, cytoplasmic-like [Argiope bruennichi]
MKLLKTKIANKYFCTSAIRRLSFVQNNRKNKINFKKAEQFSSKNVRDLFLKYFVNEKNHTYVPSSPVFLNNDPSLLFVNAGMNQFRSLFLNKTYPGHPFHDLKRAANSQKCVRLSGKHNDLKDVGVDLYHHTFFEMLGNWSFGDYSKADACKMAWELLTNVYGLKSENLYVTYFGGDKCLEVPPDEECRKIWLEIGVNPNHIFPFGAKDNFWEMADKGPCGPCTEIHYDFLNSSPEIVAQKINTDTHDVMEIWNLVFVQYNREKENILKSIPTLNVDTGMGLERLTAVLQGTRSNYDTDLFTPLFEAIESNFKVRPYLGKTGIDDTDSLDTAYRILADHSRMFSVAIADGVFPDTYDTGHVLRKIIRRAAYTANRVMKTRPGALSSLVPYVAKTLDFYPEIDKHIDEIIYIVNDEEKAFHHAINRGRKARNKMISDSPYRILTGQQAVDLHDIYGLENNIIQDLANEVNVTIDWKDYERVRERKLQQAYSQHEEKSSEVSKLINDLTKKNIPLSDDSFKYCYNTEKNIFGVKSISANILAIFFEKEMVPEAKEGAQCILVLDKTNFYSEAGGQISDVGNIYNKDFNFHVDNVTSSQGYIFHHGRVTKGKMTSNAVINLDVDQKHRLSCSQNHTATHILNAALRKILPYTAQRSSHAGPSHLKYTFSAKESLTDQQLEIIEVYANDMIQKKLDVFRNEVPFEELLTYSNTILLRGEEYPETVSVISIGSADCKDAVSVEPCCGTHVHNTADIESFVLIPAKSHGSGVKVLSAVTGDIASVVKGNGKSLCAKVSDLKQKINDALEKSNVSLDTYLDLLKQVKALIKECQTKYDAPLRDLKKSEAILTDLKLQLNDFINASSRTDMNLDASGMLNQEHKVHPQVLKDLKAKKIPPTNDTFKYEYWDKGVKSISARVAAVIRENQLVDCVERGLNCQLVLDKTNFYAEGNDQACDEGIITCEDFVIKVNKVYEVNGYVFHDGYVEEGNAVANKIVELAINEEHRLACSQNHTALHLLSKAMKNVLPYFFPLSANAGPKDLSLYFTSKGSISDDQLRIIEKNVQESIQAKLDVSQSKMPVESLKEVPPCKAALIKEFEELVPVVTIGKSDDTSALKSIEPCCGTHVKSTADVGSFIIISQKNTKNKERVIRAVTGKQALAVERDGQIYDKDLSELEERVLACLKKPKRDVLELWDCLREVKEAKVYHETELPLLLFREHQAKLTELTKQLTKATDDFVQNGFREVKDEIEDVLKKFSDKKFIIYHLSSIGDGKKIINYAIEKSTEKPALYFAKDGHKSVVCSCSVPKSLVSSSFSALLWINPVASVLEGQARTLFKDPELFYSVISKRIDKIDEAATVAKDFVESHLSNK